MLPLAASLIIAGLGVSVLMRRTPRSLNQLYFLFCASLSLWTLGGFILSHQITAHRAMYWAELLQYGMIFAPVLFLVHVCPLFLALRVSGPWKTGSRRQDTAPVSEYKIKCAPSAYLSLIASLL